MDIAMQLKISKEKAKRYELKEYCDEANERQRILENKVKDAISQVKLRKEALDGELMTDRYFPVEGSADVFISHSHKDVDIALGLAEKLRAELGISCFIDSTVWKHADELLRCIDNKFCLDSESEVYNYGKRNFSTAHVHMMLSVALNTMIDKCEVFLFLNTPNSLIPEHLSDAIEEAKDNKAKTLSPWIYYELSISQLIRKPLEECRSKKLRELLKNERSYEHFHEKLNIKHEINTSHLMSIDMKDIDLICGFRDSYRTKYQALDAIYDYLY